MSVFSGLAPRTTHRSGATLAAVADPDMRLFTSESVTEGHPDEVCRVRTAA
jgi:hypothetical protein